jgi:hypothetical protein
MRAFFGFRGACFRKETAARIALRAAVHLAAALIFLFAGGAIVRAESGSPWNFSLDRYVDSVAPANWVIWNVEGSVTATLYNLDRGILLNLEYTYDPNNAACKSDPTSPDCPWTAPRLIWQPSQTSNPVLAAAALFGVLYTDDAPQTPVQLVADTPLSMTVENKFVVFWNRMLSIIFSLAWVIAMGIIFGMKTLSLDIRGIFSELAGFVGFLFLQLIHLVLISLLLGASNLLSNAAEPSSGLGLLTLFNAAGFEASGYNLLPEYVVILTLYTIAVSGLILAMFARILIIDAVIVFAPLILWLGAWERTRPVFWAVFSLFTGVVFSQPIIVLLLSLATNIFILNAAAIMTPIFELLLASGTIASILVVSPILQMRVLSQVKSTVSDLVDALEALQ